MIDIAKCIGKECPLKLNCARYTDKPEEIWNSYIIDTPYNKEEKSCSMYLAHEHNRSWYV